MKIQELAKTPENQRDPKWEDQFLHALTESHLSLMSTDPQQGPDGWPYLLVKTDEEATESAQKMIHWLSERGIGLAINPDKEFPDFVLSYGMLWSFRETGKFIHRNVSAHSGKIEITQDSFQKRGPPTEKFLPKYVRTILKDFFRDQGVLAPKILVVSLDSENYELAFSAESLGNPPETEWSGVAEAISWFLPAHYSILILSEKALPEFSLL